MVDQSVACIASASAAAIVAIQRHDQEDGPMRAESAVTMAMPAAQALRYLADCLDRKQYECLAKLAIRLRTV
jgi:hypothetical protein